MKCEQCTVEAGTIDTAHSMLIVLQKVDKVAGYSWFQCNASLLKWQHWTCKRDHLLATATACIQSHYSEASLQAVPIAQVMLHAYVLTGDLACTVCSVPLINTAYRFCLTRATPVNVPLDKSLNERADWCCSLAHAQSSALAYLASL